MDDENSVSGESDEEGEARLGRCGPVLMEKFFPLTTGLDPVLGVCVCVCVCVKMVLSVMPDSIIIIIIIIPRE